MKKKTVSQLTEFDVHAFTHVVEETVTKSEQRLKSYIDQRLKEQSVGVDQKLEKQSRELDKNFKKQNKEFDQKLKKQSDMLIGKIDEKNREQTVELIQLMDSKNREQTDEICGVIRDVIDVNDALYVTKEEFKKHTSTIHAHQS